MKRSRVGLAIGLAVLAVYLNFALGWVALSQRATLFLAFGIGPAAIFGIVGLAERLGAAFPGRAVRTGGVFLIIAFALLTLMLTMQQALFAEYRGLRGGRPASEVPPTLRQSFALANQSQLGADVAFDVFYSLGIVFVSAALAGRRGVPRLVGVYGLVAGSGLLLLNIWTFPTPPAEAGAVDLGPATIAWWIGVIFLDRRLGRPGGEEGK
jgi:hypothetical protein